MARRKCSSRLRWTVLPGLRAKVVPFCSNRLGELPGRLGRASELFEKTGPCAQRAEHPPAPATHSRNPQNLRARTLRPAFCGALRGRRLETGRQRVFSPDFGRRSAMPNFQSPESAPAGRPRPVRDLRRPVRDGTPAPEGWGTVRPLPGAFWICLRRKRAGQPPRINDSCAAQASGRARASLETVRPAGARPSAIASTMRGER